jgi:hypothetical protein
MELSADTPPATSTELEHMGKERILGEAANLGCPGFETQNTDREAVSSGPTKSSGKTARTRRSKTTTCTAAVQRGPAAAPGGAATIQTSA